MWESPIQMSSSPTSVINSRPSPRWIMKLYEVIFHWNEEEGTDNDTIYLVRALDFRSAIEVATHSLSAQHHATQARPLIPDVVYEIGEDLALGSDVEARPLRGPYVEASYNYGWRSWHRK